MSAQSILGRQLDDIQKLRLLGREAGFDLFRDELRSWCRRTQDEIEETVSPEAARTFSPAAELDLVSDGDVSGLEEATERYRDALEKLRPFGARRGSAAMNILWQGARGPAVKKLQARLKEVGLNPGVIDGVYGPRTTAAVAVFQRDHKLPADGIAGAQTLSSLMGNTAAPATRGPGLARVFVSYSHVDAKWLQMLQVHIAPLERNETVLRWDDTRIEPGSKWREEIAAGIRSAKVAVLLISPHFMASDFIAENELPRLLQAAKHEGTAILPVIISPCTMGSLSEFQAVNSPSKPLVDLDRGDRDRVWIKLMEAITVALNK